MKILRVQIEGKVYKCVFGKSCKECDLYKKDCLQLKAIIKKCVGYVYKEVK